MLEISEAVPSFAKGDGRFAHGSTQVLSSLVAGAGIVRFAVDMTYESNQLESGMDVGIRGEPYPLSWEYSIPMHRVGDGELYGVRLDFSDILPGSRIQYRFVRQRTLAEVEWEAAMEGTGNRTFLYSGRSINLDPVFWSNVSVSVDEVEELPRELTLQQNYPNPFNPRTIIRFGMPQHGRMDLIVHDVLGREAVRLLSGEAAAGYHEVEWDASAFASGVYFYRLQAGGEVRSRKLVLLR